MRSIDRGERGSGLGIVARILGGDVHITGRTAIGAFGLGGSIRLAVQIRVRARTLRAGCVRDLVSRSAGARFARTPGAKFTRFAGVGPSGAGIRYGWPRLAGLTGLTGLTRLTGFPRLTCLPGCSGFAVRFGHGFAGTIRSFAGFPGLCFAGFVLSQIARWHLAGFAHPFTGLAETAIGPGKLLRSLVRLARPGIRRSSITRLIRWPGCLFRRLTSPGISGFSCVVRLLRGLALAQWFTLVSGLALTGKPGLILRLLARLIWRPVSRIRRLTLVCRFGRIRGFHRPGLVRWLTFVHRPGLVRWLTFVRRLGLVCGVSRIRWLTCTGSFRAGPASVLRGLLARLGCGCRGFGTGVGFGNLAAVRGLGTGLAGLLCLIGCLGAGGRGLSLLGFRPGWPRFTCFPRTGRCLSGAFPGCFRRGSLLALCPSRR